MTHLFSVCCRQEPKDPQFEPHQITPKWSRWKSFLLNLFVLVPKIMIYQKNKQQIKKALFSISFYTLDQGQGSLANLRGRIAIALSAGGSQCWTKIGPALWKIGSTGFVRICTNDAFSWHLTQFSAKADDFDIRTLLIFGKIGPSSKALEGTPSI